MAKRHASVFTWLKPDNITGADFLDRPALTLDEAKACRDDKRLSSGCVCQAVRAPGSKVTVLASARLASLATNKGSIRTLPVNHSAGPLREACDPFRVISTIFLHLADLWVLGLSIQCALEAQQCQARKEKNEQDKRHHLSRNIGKPCPFSITARTMRRK